MENSKKKFDEEVAPAIQNTHLPDSDLLPRREAKSVRTTITISSGTLDSMQWLKDTQEIKSKEVLDAVLGSEDLIEAILRAADEAEPVKASKTIRKSIVLSNPALRKLNELAKKHSRSRDSLISMAIKLMKVLIEKLNEETREKHKQALDIVDKAWSHIGVVEKELVSLLGKNDPIATRWGFVVVLTMNLSLAIQSELEGGIPIDPDDFSQSC